jgi:hypothetical protein
MRIPSDKKLELQARKNVENDPRLKPSEEWDTIYNTLETEHHKLCREWQPFQDKCHAQSNGDSNKCICATFPEYITIHEKSVPIAKKMNDMWYEQNRKKELAYQLELARLKSVRSTKLKYHNSR